MSDVQWNEVFDAGNGRLTLPSVERCIIRGAASPLNSDLVTTRAGDVPGKIPIEVTVNVLPAELKTIELELTGDLWLRLPAGSHDIDIRVSSPDLSRWFAISGGQVRSLTAVDSYVGGISASTAEGAVHLAVLTRVRRLTMESIDNKSVSLGYVEAGEILVTGNASLYIEGFPLNPSVEVRTGSIAVRSGRILLGSTLFAGRIAKHTRITCETNDSKVVLGETLDFADTTSLTMEGGHLHVRRGEVGPLHMIDMKKLEIGDDLDPPGKVGSVEAKTKQVLAAELGYGLVTQASGNVRELQLQHRGVVSGDSRLGFSAERIAAAETSEISGLDARDFNLYSAGMLREVRRLGLWVNPSTRKARSHFEAEVHGASTESEPALFELAHRRKQLLSLAIQTQQDGHTLSVLREAEKDARRASLPWRSRERLLLELWRHILGYGERIGFPLLLGTGLIALLGVGEVGWSRFWSRDWWAGWSHISRVNSVFNFALPGIDAFGIDGIGGFWGVSAKILSVVFFASAASAAIRVVKRGE